MKLNNHTFVLCLDEAYVWLCQQRMDYNANNSIWDLRYRWSVLKNQIILDIFNSTYKISPLQRIDNNLDGIKVWTASDSLVLKAITIYLSKFMPVKDLGPAKHLKDRGGIHAAVAEVKQAKPGYKFILKSDIYHYYESIDHTILMSICARYISSPILLDLISQYCDRVEIKHAIYFSHNPGIPEGCPLSPLIAALYLKPLDEEMAKHKVFYVRFMDDWIVMTKTRHQLRKLIKKTYQVLHFLRLKMHPDKTFIGKTSKGFTFLGLEFSDKIQISPQSTTNHLTKIAQRYARGLSEAQVGDYIVRWRRWCQGLLKAAGSNSSPPDSLIMFNSNQFSLCFNHDIIRTRYHRAMQHVNKAQILEIRS